MNKIHREYETVTNAKPRNNGKLAHLFHDLLYIAKYTAVVYIFAAVLTAIICWVGGWWEADLYGIALEYMAIAVLVVGLILLLGASNVVDRNAVMISLAYTGSSSLADKRKRSGSGVVLGIVFLLAVILLYTTGEVLFRYFSEI